MASDSPNLIPEQAIRTLLEIRGLPTTDFWKVAELEWEKTERKFAARAATSKGQILNVSNEIYQVVGFAAAFQGLLLAAVSQGGELNCNGFGHFLLGLSLFGTLASTAAVWEKTRIITWLRKSVDKDEDTAVKHAVRLQLLRERGPRFFYFKELVESEAGDLKPLTRLEKVGSTVATVIWPPYSYRVLYCVVIFGVLCACAIHYILCDNPAA